MPRGKAATAPPAEEQNGEKDFTAYAEKDLTPLQEDFVEWLTNEVGYDPDPKSVQLGVVLYHDFQASEFNKTRKADRRAQAQADAEAARQEREEARAAKAAQREEAAAAKTAAAQEKASSTSAKATGAGTRRGRKPATQAGTTKRRGRTASKEAAPY